MIGNDIVDLALAKTESNWKRPGYLDKVFTPLEQKYIYESAHPDKMVWLLWSMKESAYKLHVQLQGKRFFGPKMFSCKLLKINDHEGYGKVVCGVFGCFIQSEMSDKFVYTISSLEENKEYFSQIVSIKNPQYISQHAEVYKRVIAEYSGKSQHQVCIKKNNNGIPFLYANKIKVKAAISISHHGNYGAFVIEES